MVYQFLNINSIAGIGGGGNPSAVDWNNDGWDDLALGGNYYQNNGNGTYTNVTSKSGLPGANTSWGDFNNDGFI